MNRSDLLALDELYTARESFRRSPVLAGLDLDYNIALVLRDGLTALVDWQFAQRVMNTLDVRPGTTLVEVVTEILEEA